MSGKLIRSYVKDYVVFDLETTGINPLSDEIIEISAVKVINEEVVDEFSSLVNPHMPIPYGASSVNGITDDMVEDEPDIEEILPKFLEFIGDMVLVGHNIHNFDLKFIDRDCAKYIGLVPSNDYLDTLKYARENLFGLSNYRLTTLAAHYNISSKGAHRALNDCIMNQQVFKLLSMENVEDNLLKSGMRKCPKCGGILRKRNGMYGEFYGCSSYPDCRYTEKI